MDFYTKHFRQKLLTKVLKCQGTQFIEIVGGGQMFCPS